MLTAPSKPGFYFEPTATQYQTYPWLDPAVANAEPSSGLKGNQRLNYLLYCETTQNRPLPPLEQRELPRKGNWTDGRLESEANSDNCEFGSFHMARENFFDGYLLKKLKVFTRALEPHMKYHNVSIQDVPGLNPKWCVVCHTSSAL